MKKLNKLVALGAMVLAVGATSMTAFASTNCERPANIIAGLTGRTIQSVTTERQETGKTCGTIAAEAGKLDEFKTQMLDLREYIINSLVSSGKMTQERADEIMNNIKERQEACDGTGYQNNGKNCPIVVDSEDDTNTEETATIDNEETPEVVNVANTEDVATDDNEEQEVLSATNVEDATTDDVQNDVTCPNGGDCEECETCDGNECETNCPIGNGCNTQNRGTCANGTGNGLFGNRADCTNTDGAQFGGFMRGLNFFNCK